MYLITCTYINHSCCRFDALCNLVKLFFSKCLHVRKEESQTTSKVPQNSRRRIRFSPSGTTKQSLKRNGPLNMKTIEQSLKRNRPLDAQGIEQILKRNGQSDMQGFEQILKRNGLLKDSDIAIVLNVHLARRKELRSLKGLSYLYNLPLISRWIT